MHKDIVNFHLQHMQHYDFGKLKSISMRCFTSMIRCRLLVAGESVSRTNNLIKKNYIWRQLRFELMVICVVFTNCYNIYLLSTTNVPSWLKEVLRPWVRKNFVQNLSLQFCILLFFYNIYNTIRVGFFNTRCHVYEIICVHLVITATYS